MPGIKYLGRTKLPEKKENKGKKEGGRTEMERRKEEKEGGEGEETGILSILVAVLKRDLGPALEEIEVKDVRIGLAYTGVLISENYGGVACTPLYEFSCCPALGFTETLKGKTADKVLELALSENPLEAAVGIATANALSHMLRDLEPEHFQRSYLDILDLIKPGDRVAMVGYFGPLVPRILKITEKLTVLEKREIETPKTRTLPSDKAREILPASDVIILSASTLANRTFDELLSLRGAAREVVLLGPSAPLYPEPFFKQGITAVMGTRIIAPETMLTVVSEAGGTKKLHQYCGEKVAFQNKKEKQE
ncbi:Rossmann-like domain-containing protein [Methanosarcina sp. T3]|uniref:Rossmann-like domain-containing protein n=1 Tax=Methanosarcina sp. T3 TaxID=3439062 RepID=UPI003F841932